MLNTSLKNIMTLINTNTLGLVEEENETEENIELICKEYPDITILFKPLYVGNSIAKFMTENIYFDATKWSAEANSGKNHEVKRNDFGNVNERGNEINEESLSDIKVNERVNDYDINIENKIAEELITASVKQELPKLDKIVELLHHKEKITDVETEIYDFFVLKRVENVLLSMSLLEFILANVSGTEESIDTFLDKEIWNVYLKIYDVLQ
jgi:hypothetical protein